MVAAHSKFWTAVDEQIVACNLDAVDKPEAKVVALASAAGGSSLAQKQSAQSSAPASDWAGVLNTIVAAKDLAEQQAARMQEQAEAHRKSIEGLHEELRQTREQMLAAAAHVRDVEARCEAKIREAVAQAEAYVREVERDAGEHVHAAEVQANAARIRAETAEGWLRKIEHAAKSLVTSDRSAAAPQT